MRLGGAVLIEGELINAPARVDDEVLPVGRPVGCLPYRVRTIEQARRAIVQIVDEETTAQVLVIGYSFYVGRRRLRLEIGSGQKNAVRVSLPNRNWIERTFMFVTLLFG